MKLRILTAAAAIALTSCGLPWSASSDGKGGIIITPPPVIVIPTK